MLRPMSLRRLPLAASAEPPAATPPAQLVQGLVAGAALVVGDSGDGDGSLRWAGRLQQALTRLMVRAEVVLVGVEPTNAALRPWFVPQTPLHGLEPAQLDGSVDVRAWLSAQAPRSDAPVGAGEDGSVPEPSLLLLAGPWAPLAFRGRLNVLIGADRPVLRWPDALRAQRGRFDLELSGDGLAVVNALAHALHESWR